MLSLTSSVSKLVSMVPGNPVDDLTNGTKLRDALFSAPFESLASILSALLNFPRGRSNLLFLDVEIELSILSKTI